MDFKHRSFALQSSFASGEEFVKSQQLDALDEVDLLMQSGESYLPLGNSTIEFRYLMKSDIFFCALHDLRL